MGLGYKFLSRSLSALACVHTHLIICLLEQIRASPLQAAKLQLHSGPKKMQEGTLGGV